MWESRAHRSGEFCDALALLGDVGHMLGEERLLILRLLGVLRGGGRVALVHLDELAHELCHVSLQLLIAAVQLVQLLLRLAQLLRGQRQLHKHLTLMLLLRENSNMFEHNSSKPTGHPLLQLHLFVRIARSKVAAVLYNLGGIVRRDIE